jgi:hypothetical protein
VGVFRTKFLLQRWLLIHLPPNHTIRLVCGDGFACRFSVLRWQIIAYLTLFNILISSTATRPHYVHYHRAGDKEPVQAILVCLGGSWTIYAYLSAVYALPLPPEHTIGKLRGAARTRDTSPAGVLRWQLLTYAIHFK